MLRGLLQRDPERRLTFEQIKVHPFFASIDWDRLERREIEPEFVPKTGNIQDTSNIDKMFTDEEARETLVGDRPDLRKAKIEQFTYVGGDGPL